MNHRPFEDWLLDDQPLTAQQERDLQAHLRSCTSCTGIAESNLALHTTRIVAAPVGFSDRFNARFLRWRQQQRWHQVIGTVVLVLGGLGIISWLAGPVIQQALDSPAALITEAARYLVFLLTSFRALSAVMLILLRDLPSLVPPVGWLLVILGSAAAGFIWILTVRRLAHSPQGV